MKWLSKLKKDLAAKDQSMREKQTIEKYRATSLAKQCMECKHFTDREEKPRNWVCRCPDAELRFVGSTCIGFKYGTHPEMVVYNSGR